MLSSKPHPQYMLNQIAINRLSENKTKKLLNFWVSGTTARIATELVGINRNTATNFYDKIRQIIVTNIGKESPDTASEKSCSVKDKHLDRRTRLKLTFQFVRKLHKRMAFHH